MQKEAKLGWIGSSSEQSPLTHTRTSFTDCCTQCHLSTSMPTRHITSTGIHLHLALCTTHSQNRFSWTLAVWSLLSWYAACAPKKVFCWLPLPLRKLYRITPGICYLLTLLSSFPTTQSITDTIICKKELTRLPSNNHFILFGTGHSVLTPK